VWTIGGSHLKPLDQFQPDLVGNMLGGWGFRFVQAPLGQNKEHFDKSSKLFSK